jgi:hypothetical protein
MSSAESASTQTLRETADLASSRPRSRHIMADGHRADFEALVRPETGNRGTAAEPRADPSRGPAAFNTIALWLRRALADSARAWALAAGVPPDLYH